MRGCGTDADYGDAEHVPYKTGSENEERLTLSDYIYETYNTLLENGWKMGEIDEMDILGYLKVRAWKLQKQEKKNAPKRAEYIDEFWPTWL